jgi:hypothetical protein
MYHDRSGRFVRIGLIALIFTAVGVGYFAWSASSPAPQTAAVVPMQEQQFADSGYRAQPEQIPQTQPVVPTPPQAAPAPARRATPATRRSRAEPAPEESAPPPVSDVPATPIPPVTNTPQLPDTTPPAQG